MATIGWRDDSTQKSIGHNTIKQTNRLLALVITKALLKGHLLAKFTSTDDGIIALCYRRSSSCRRLITFLVEIAALAEIVPSRQKEVAISVSNVYHFILVEKLIKL